MGRFGKLWDTDLSYLGFTSGDDKEHNIYLAASDLGPNGYNNNFAWGTLSIEDQTLKLYDGNNDNDGGALYLGALLGAEIDQDGKTVTNIFGQDGLNIYYLAFLDENAYLGGLTYDLMEGGKLRPSNVPIPSAVWLMGSGLILIVGLKRKRRPV